MIEASEAFLQFLATEQVPPQCPLLYIEWAGVRESGPREHTDLAFGISTHISLPRTSVMTILLHPWSVVNPSTAYQAQVVHGRS